MDFTGLTPVSSDPLVPFTDQLRLAVAAYLARFKGSSRDHTESDLRCYLAWCAGHGLDPLAARRPHLELYIRWMQEVRRLKPSTISRRFSVTGRVLPDLCHRRPAGALTRRTRPPAAQSAPSVSTYGRNVEVPIKRVLALTIRAVYLASLALLYLTLETRVPRGQLSSDTR